MTDFIISNYGYWIDLTGKICPVSRAQEHSGWQLENTGLTKPAALVLGWVRLWVASKTVYVESYLPPNSDQEAALVQISAAHNKPLTDENSGCVLDIKLTKESQ